MFICECAWECVCVHKLCIHTLLYNCLYTLFVFVVPVEYILTKLSCAKFHTGTQYTATAAVLFYYKYAKLRQKKKKIQEKSCSGTPNMIPSYGLAEMRGDTSLTLKPFGKELLSIPID